jgi:hypothetical protein
MANGGNSPASIEVKITVKRGSHGLAHFTYDPSTFMCKRGDTIKWKCNQGTFALHFGERALLGQITIPGKNPCSANAADGFESDEFHVGNNGFSAERLALQPGMYKYSVAVNVTQNHGDLPPGLYIDACPSGGYVC